MTTRLIVLLLSASALLTAQTAPGRYQPDNHATTQIVINIRPNLGLTVAGAPFSGVLVNEDVLALPNGDVIRHQTEAKIYRDSTGRTRMENTIHNPVAGVLRELDPQAKTSRETAAVVGHGNRPGAGQVRPDPNVLRENLPPQTVNGVQATGLRVTRTIPAGQAGNAEAFQIVKEIWTSSDLQRPVLTREVDPRTGTHLSQLTHITRNEPDPALFQTPSDYQIIQTRRSSQ